MKVTYSWLKDFVDIRMAPRALADKLTMAGLEVVSLEEKEGDVVFEIEITSNRPDWLSVIGIAREVAAVTGRKIRLPSTTQISELRVGGKIKGQSHRPLAIKIEDKKDCPSYTAKIIRGIKVGPSPDWLKKRLELVGCRSINNIVDTTNYILFEQGEPLHAFDLDKLNGKNIFIRRAKPQETIITLDGVERKLDSDILVIADSKRAVAIAGVMGGKDTEVTEGTKNILLEAAVFNARTIRHSRQKLGLQSESSYRFERGIDIDTARRASWQAAAMMKELSAGVLVSAKSAGVNKAKKKTIIFKQENVCKVLGVTIPMAQTKAALLRLGLRVKRSSKSSIAVDIPSCRQDLNFEIDLIEEIARVYGYDKVPDTLASTKPQVVKFQARHWVTLTKNILAGLGLQEVITYTLIDKEMLNDLMWQDGSTPKEILNPLSKEQEILRPTIIPGLVRCVAYNLNQKQDNVAIFEVAKAFPGSLDLPNEELRLAIALCGTKNFFLKQGIMREEYSILHLKGILEALFKRLGIAGYDFSCEKDGISVGIFVHQEKLGVMGGLRKETLERHGIKNKEVFVAEIRLEKIYSAASLQKKFIPLTKFPAITRDISFVMKESIPIREVLRALQEKAGPLLNELRIVDHYKGKQIPADCRGFTLSCVYRSKERTLTEAEVIPLHELILSVLSEGFAAKIR